MEMYRIIFYLQYVHLSNYRLIFVVRTHMRSQHISIFVPLVTVLALGLAVLVGCDQMSGGIALGAE